MRAKSPRTSPFGELQPLPIPQRPWGSVSMDFIVKLPHSEKFDTILVVVCRLTKMAHFIPMTESSDAPQVAKLIIHEIVRLHGIPDN